jgi:hypothetical protein
MVSLAAALSKSRRAEGILNLNPFAMIKSQSAVL